MVNDPRTLVAVLTATALLTAGAALAANQSTTDQQKTTPQQASADKDFGKLSADGASAFHDLSLTRLAIFDGRTDDAKKLVNMAEAAFNKAKTDDTVFTKAEADLKPPVAKEAMANKSAAAATPSDANQTEQLKKPIAWLPVDGSITIEEDYAANPAKTAAVAEANKSLKSGDRKGALEKLKLADMKVAVMVAVLPIEKTIDKVHQAAALINDGKYYEASQDLRQAQANERFDVAGNLGTPSE